MTNAQIITTLVTKLSARIDYRMQENGDTYAQAKAYVMPSTTAGTSVWAALDAKYAA